ncbi:putative AC transposase [Fusarium oxysporum f. sp. raphani]|uniref:Putative AC transposase n=2 Tax=Fusarium oxysporum f. sp. raphani TaxID=96318 RepID=A0A8J5NWH0_FUSOX|nr:putative AC transposase [Fusarium oxysporum f. sp. raphani]
MDVSVPSLAQSSATSSSSSVLPSDSASQFASTLSEPEASSTEHTVKRRKLRAIATWDHFRGAQGDEPRAISGNLLHYCKRCRNPSWSTHISSNARYHLKKAHHIFVREDSSSQNKRQLAIENAFARTTARQLKQVREHERNTLRSVINVDAFREAQMLLSAHRHLPLNFVTWPEYQALLTAVNPAVQEFLTDSGNTVAADLDRAYDAHQQSVKKWLEHARSLVHIAMDVWSSPQRKAYVAVHAQWVDEAYKPRKALLGLPNLRRSHAGAAMTPHLMEIIRKYHLAPRIGYFTGDNDAKNDTCLRQLAVGLSQEYGLTFDPVSSRTRCAGHIINLSLQAFLFATSEDALQAAIEQAQDEANDVTVSDALHDRIQSNTCQKSHGRRNKRNDTAGWRSIGPMGKLHNIAVFIRNSTVRNDAWDDIAGKALGIDNITRWNSWFKLLDAAISQEGPLSIFLNQYHEELEDDILTHDDWQVLKMTHEFLQPFYQATLEQQMEWASIDQVLENMDILFLQFENAKVKYVNNARMVNSVHMGWWVLSKYYEESDKNPIYATALLLHPEKRRRYLDRHWAEEWRQTAIAGARRHWAKYKDRPLSSDSAARLSNERREVTPYERIKQSMSVLDEPGDEDEFEKFYLQSCADAAWSKCAEYYNNQQLNWQNRFPEDTDLPPAYYAAQILDPYRKWAWFRQEWVLHGDEEKRRWFDNAQSAVKHLWETEYKGRHPVEMLPPPARKERAPDPAFDRQREHKRIRTDAPVSTTDLYEQYISTDRLHDDEAGYDDAIAYWLSRYDSQRDLARFALDLFAISPMSDECERLFSSAKLTIVDRRGRLKVDIIEACECLRAWYGKPQVEDDSDSEDSENDNEWIDSYS